MPCERLQSFNMAATFNVGDLVWAKMKGFSPWPGKVSGLCPGSKPGVVSPTKDVKRPANKKPMQCVFFFGTDNYAWIPEDSIKPYDKFKEQMIKQNKTSTFREAVEAIEDYIRNRPAVPIKTSDLPSIDEEIATIFPNGSNRSPPHKDYSRQPFQNKPKQNSSSKPLSDSELAKLNSDASAKPLPPPLKEMKESTREHKEKKEKLKRDSHAPSMKSSGSKRSSDSSGTSHGPPGTKRSKMIDKYNDKASTSTSYGHSPGSTSSLSPQLNHGSPRKTAENLLMRPTYVTRPVAAYLGDRENVLQSANESKIASVLITPPLDVEKVSETLKRKNIKASCLNFGFLGLGIMGQGIVKNLINSGHSVTVWNRTPSKCRDFVKAGAVKLQTPADVIAASDITFSCVADPKAAKDLVFGNCGVLQEICSPKGYVEMTSIDAETSNDIAEIAQGDFSSIIEGGLSQHNLILLSHADTMAITARGGRYLEAQLQGSKAQAEEGMLVILAAGDRHLFDDCQTCFQAMGKSSFYLGDVGNAAKMNLVINVMMGTMLAGLAEGMALADRAGLQQKDVLEVLELSSLSCNAILDKGKAIIEGAFPTAFPLQHMQKDLRLALELGDQLEQPLPLASTANEVFKHTKRLGYGEHDVSAVYIRARF